MIGGTRCQEVGGTKTVSLLGLGVNYLKGIIFVVLLND